MAKPAIDIASSPDAFQEALVFRRARWSDRDGVLNITPAAFDGLDYLPSMYDGFLCDSKRLSFVCEMKGQIVSFVMIYVVNNDQTAIIEGKRTVDRFCNLGINKKLTDHALVASKREFPGLQTVAFTTSYEKYLEHPNLKMRKGNISLLTTASALKQLLPRRQGQISNYVEQTIQLPNHAAAALMASPDIVSKLFCDRCVIPYAVTTSNIDTILKGKTVFGNQSTNSMSFANTVHSAAAILYVLDVYVDINSNENEASNDVIAHLLAHAHSVKQWQSERDISINLIFPAALEKEKMLDLCVSLGFQKGPAEPANAFVVEVPLEDYCIDAYQAQ